MLHLLPIRYLLAVTIALVGSVVLLTAYFGAAPDDLSAQIWWIMRSASSAALVLSIASYACWRWLPGVQRITFPYLGGSWKGELAFEGPQGIGVRDVTLQIRHTLFSIVLILDSAESTSRTLAVHAERDEGFDRKRLYYIYLNERKEGTSGAGDSYMGLAVLRVEMTRPATLQGNYFTEKRGSGKLTLSHDEPNPWWMLWR